MSLSQTSDISPWDQTRQFLLSVARAMRVCAESAEHQSVVERFTEDLRLATTKSPPSTPKTTPNELGRARDTRLACQLIDLSDHLPWAESFRTPNMANRIAACSFNDLFDLKHHTAGLLYLDPGLVYPEHQHPPPELYFTLSGTAAWRYGGSQEYRVISAGNLLHNDSLGLHGVRSGDTPLLAFFLLSGKFG